MLRRGWLQGELVVVVLATAALGACGTESAINAGTAAGPSGSGPSATTAAQPYRLYTHCGIDEARIGQSLLRGRPSAQRWARQSPRWLGNPFQQGTMTLLSTSEAVFRDDAGHHVLFRVRPGATSFRYLCS
jgi:hypothetical protein